ncbi:MAG: hypothetical protein IJI51_03310, partial [Lachnospiraceae bacterium]|nr:hypothetical protein [Lachnospiraceae bacterium]
EGIIKEYTDENGVFYPEAGPAGGDDFVDALEYAENLTDYYVTNSISTEASFITNASMVFEDGYVYCRGVLELKSFGGDANTITCLPMEIMMKQAGELDFEIVGIMPVEGYAEFEFERPSGDAE